MIVKWKCPNCGKGDKITEGQREHGIAVCMCGKCYCNYTILLENKDWEIVIRKKK